MREPRGYDANAPGILGFLVLFWLLLSVGSYFLVVVPRENRFDFFPRWVGARAILGRETPYSDETTLRIQEGMFGRRLGPQEDQQRFAYSAMVAWLLLPFWLLPFVWAASLWLGLQLLSLLILPIWAASILGWRLRPASLILLLTFSIVIFRYPINAYLIGQFIPFCFACLVAGWWGAVRGHWIVASSALLFAMVRPEVVVFPLLAILATVWDKGERRIAFAWFTGLALLWILTRAWIGPWEMDYVNGIVAYQAYSSPVWPPGLLNQTWLAVALVMAVLGWALWLWREVRTLEIAERLAWLVASASLTSLIVLPQTGNYTLILGLLSAWVILWASNGKPMYWLLVLAVLASPWLFLLARGIPDEYEHLLIPMALAVMLTLTWRHRWRIVTRMQFPTLPVDRGR